MADPIRLSGHDRAMIHALQVLSRPPLTDRKNMAMVADILRSVMPGVNRNNARLLPLICLADQVLLYRPVRQGCFGGLHDRAWRVMNRWDQQGLAEHWDRIRGVT